MNINWKQVLEAGFAAGLVFVIMEIVLVGIFMGTPWGPPRMIAAIAMGEDVLPPPPSFDLGVLIVAMIIHFILSFILAAIYALLLTRFSRGIVAALIVGALFGLAVYLINFFVLTAVFPWFAGARTWITLISHIVFGMILGVMLMPRKALEHDDGADRTVAA